MSRVAKAPIKVPGNIEIAIAGQSVSVKGPKGKMEWTVHPSVTVSQGDGKLHIGPADQERPAWAMAGTTRALLNNMVVGCDTGFVRKLSLVGVGYRAQAQGRTLTLALGFSHPVHYAIPDGIEIATPSPTEIHVSGADKQQVGQVAAHIRRYRPPEPYKGKGVRYADEEVLRKEAKKK